VNGAVLPRRQWDSARLAAGDEIEIVRPFGGG
jgi:thiamine biosynthesis protein ThiS